MRYKFLRLQSQKLRERRSTCLALQISAISMDFNFQTAKLDPIALRYGWLRKEYEKLGYATKGPFIKIFPHPLFASALLNRFLLRLCLHRIFRIGAKHHVFIESGF
jgi:hypothetical protein